jgi:hypothetical protein
MKTDRKKRLEDNTFVLGLPALSFSMNRGIPKGPKSGDAFKQSLKVYE